MVEVGRGRVDTVRISEASHVLGCVLRLLRRNFQRVGAAGDDQLQSLELGRVLLGLLSHELLVTQILGCGALLKEFLDVSKGDVRGGGLGLGLLDLLSASTSLVLVSLSFLPILRPPNAM